MSTAMHGDHSQRPPVPLTPLRWPDRDGGVHLPASLTPLVGREREADALCALLRGDDRHAQGASYTRLVTLTGPGGVGKTRLALHVAETLADAFPDGVVFVPLDSVRDAELVLTTVGQELGVRDTGGPPLVERLRAVLRHQTILLVLDNFEQVVAAAPHVGALLTACPGLNVLVTSRSRLRLSGEHAFPLPPLATPDHRAPLSVARLGEVASVRLFVERARAVEPDFALGAANAGTVAEICRRLDGLPLAIELAAARVAVLPPAALLARLGTRLPMLTGGPRDQPTRLQTMRDAIGWSYDLLNPEEQALFLRLSVFAGGFSLDAASWVMGTADSPSPDILDLLASLVDKSLVRRQQGAGDEPRFAMLETIREFAWEQLDARGEVAATRRRHAEWCAAVAEEADRHVGRGDLAVWWPRLVAEHANLRAALDWFDANADAAGLLRLAAALWRFWYHDSHLSEGRRWLERALAVGSDAPARLRIEMLTGAALIAHFQEDDAAAIALCDEASVLCRRHDERAGLARVLYVQGLVDEDAGRYAAAASRFGEARSLFDAVGDEFWAGLAMSHLGIVAYGQGEFERARVLLDQALGWHRARDYRWSMNHALVYRAQAELERGDAADARAALVEALALSVELGAPRSIAIDTISTIAALGVAAGQPEWSTRLLGWAANQRAIAGAMSHLPERALYERAAHRAKILLGERLFAAAWEAGKALPTEEALGEAGALLAETDAAAGAHGLTPREVEVLRLLTRRATDKEIAAILSISPRTAMHHVASILAKLDVKTRREAAAWAADRDLA